ncbi:ATP/GTP-binding protein [Rhizobium rhizogenes]|uniref:AAA family ATPase n=1 Tax=Rhizobium rhizogenes TaxID=359 RepID=UPI000647AED0|nr:AAA family ATPase [Rhizobium rhizogenes]
MLLQFSVENFLSFRGEARFSMMASADDHHPRHVLSPKNHKRRVLRSAAIYGANGHGKTNLVHALIFIRDLIIDGSEVDKPLKVRKFKTSAGEDNSPATFIFNILTGGVEYEYGMKVARSHIQEEWLFSSPNGREVPLFERVTNKGKDGLSTTVEAGPSLVKKTKSGKLSGKDYLDFVAFGTRPNQPFLTEAIQRNVEALRPIFDWFRNDLQIISAEGEYAALEIRAHKDSDFVGKLSTAIRNAGIGIDHIETDVRTIEIDDFRDVPSEMLREISNTLDTGNVALLGARDSNRILIRKNDDNELEVIDLVFVHKREDGSEVRFTQDEESAGTRRLLHLLPMIADLSQSDKTFVIDEIDRKLHPLLAYNLLSNFLGDSDCGQLVFTTHNTHLLDLDLLRRDEVWFVEKTTDGDSQLYSLADLKVRADVEIRKGYLNGRFGAIPFLGSTQGLGWEEQVNARINKQKKTPA